MLSKQEVSGFCLYYKRCSLNRKFLVSVCIIKDVSKQEVSGFYLYYKRCSVNSNTDSNW